jgi:hypothetical protein
VSPWSPICQTRRPSAKTLRYGAELAENRNGRSSSLRVKDIDLTGLGQVSPEEVPRTILVAADGEAGRVADRFITRPTRANRGARFGTRGCGLGLVVASG